MALANDYQRLFAMMRGMRSGGDEVYATEIASTTSAHANTWQANLIAYPQTPVPCSSSPSPFDELILDSCVAMRGMTSGGNKQHANDLGEAFHQMITAGFSATIFSGNLGLLQNGLYSAFINGRGDDDIASLMAEAVTGYLLGGGAV